MAGKQQLGFIPYHGSHSQHSRGATLRRYGADQSGDKTYEFNSLGYRGPEASDAARARILTSGCSYTIGEGLDYHETWASRFADRYAVHGGLEAAEVSLINLAQGGASNDYIARTVLPNLPRVNPDLVVLLFTYKDRAEAVLDDPGNAPLIASIGPWSVEGIERVDASEFTNDQARQLAVLEEGASHYYLTYTDDAGLISTLRNMLLVQFACRAQAIPYLFSWVEHALLDALPDHPNPIVRDLSCCLDRGAFCGTSPTDYAQTLDVALHAPGQRRH